MDKASQRKKPKIALLLNEFVLFACQSRRKSFSKYQGAAANTTVVLIISVSTEEGLKL
jgi:hypothetical protein